MSRWKTYGGRFNEEERRKIEGYLERVGITKNELIRDAVLLYIDGSEKRASKKRYKPKVRYAKEWFTPEEFERFMCVVEDRRDRVLFWLLYGCALRVSEALNLRVRDVNLERRELIIWESKNQSAPVTLPVPRVVINEIDGFLENRDGIERDEHLILSHTGKPCKLGRLTKDWAYMLVAEYAKKAGIPKKLGTHSFRRSRAQHLLDAGMRIEDVSKFLRHKSLSTTMEYLNLSSERLREIVALYDPLEQL